MRVSSVWMAITGIFNSHLMLALAIEKFGTEPQKRHWLPKLASGEVRADWPSPNPMRAPTCRRSGSPRAARATTMC